MCRDEIVVEFKGLGSRLGGGIRNSHAMYRAPLDQIICLLLSPLRPRPSSLVVVCGVASGGGVGGVGGGGGGCRDDMGGVGGVAAVDVVDVAGGGCVAEELLGIVALRHGRC